MVSIPFELFVSTIGLSLAVGLIGLTGRSKNIPLMLMMAGAFITFLAIITDEIKMGNIPVSSTFNNATNTTTYVFADDNFTFTAWHKITISLLGSITMIAGALIWKQEED